ncbi:MAG TPA: alpha/beta hydrolase, partial [Candidatus Ozemobacteraceae bacterium]|nr:alpha/beta hydrolase [Candidatus Ozemobacteraceae bacterium]
TCLKVALKRPDVVTGLGLIAPFVQPRDPNESPSAIPGMAKGYFLRSLLGIAMPFLAQSKLRQHLARVWEPAEIPSLTLEDELHQYTVFEILLATMNDKNDLLKLFKEVQGKLGEIKCPSLAVAGEKDAVCDASEQLRVLGDKLPGLKSVKLADGGHGLPFTHAEQLSQAVIAEFGTGTTH